MMNESGVSREVSEKIPLERPKTQVTEFEKEMKEKEEILPLTRLGEQVEPAKAVVAKVMEAMRPRLGNSDFENLQGAPGTLGPGVSALHGRLLSQSL